MNKKNIRVSGRLRFFLSALLFLGLVLIVITLYTYTQSIMAGAILTGFLLLYFCLLMLCYARMSSVFMYEMISFATQYGQVQKQLLKNFDLPYAVLDEDGKVVWANLSFERLTETKSGAGKTIHSIFNEITLDKLPGKDEDFGESEVEVEYKDGDYLCRMRRIPLNDMVTQNALLETTPDYQGHLTAICLYDNTALKIALKEVDDQSLAVALIDIDNYDEALESVEEVRRSLLTALIERKINKYMSSMDGITKKLEKDKYMVILRKKSLKQLRDSKFDILDDVKTVNIGNEMAVTLSIGVGLDGLSYGQNYEFARAAIDMALGRGGDQAVVKTPDQLTYYGGKSQQVEKNTRVKARVKAHALMEIVSGKDQVFIMGHRNGDVDSFGASIGVYAIARALERKAHIVLDTITPSMKPFVEMFAGNPDYDNDFIVNGRTAMEIAGNNAVLVIVDVNKPSITECPDLIGKCKSVVVLDHHRQSNEAVENATLSYVEPYASSTCEMVSEILQYTTDNLKIKNDEADAIYSGIMIDTNNFTQKTGVRTFEAAAFLKRNGADVTRVRKLFRENVGDYKAKADAVSQAEIYQNYYAISICEAEDCESPTVVGAQAANELLNIKGIRASFVFTYYQNQVFISARSIDEVNVQIIMEKMGGGGHMSVAGAQLSDTTIDGGIQLLKDTLDNMIQEGEI